MVTITAPKDAYCSPDTVLTWSCSLSGQTKYQLEYRLKDGAWNSLAAVLSSTQSCNLNSLFAAIGSKYDFSEYEYRIHVWGSTSNTEGNGANGKKNWEDYSDTFNLVFKPVKTGSICVGTEKLPVFNQVDTAKRLGMPGGRVPIVGYRHPLESRVKVGGERSSRDSSLYCQLCAG